MSLALITLDATDPAALVEKPSEVWVRVVNVAGPSGFPEVDLFGQERDVVDFIRDHWGQDEVNRLAEERLIPSMYLVKAEEDTPEQLYADWRADRITDAEYRTRLACIGYRKPHTGGRPVLNRAENR